MSLIGVVLIQDVKPIKPLIGQLYATALCSCLLESLSSNERDLWALFHVLSPKKCPVFIPVFCCHFWLFLAHMMRQEESFLDCEHAPQLLYLAPGEISHLSPQCLLCPCQKDRIKWKPTLLLRMSRILKYTDHLVIQGSVWPLPVGGCEPCYSQTSFSKVWAEESRNFVGQSFWAPFFEQEPGTCGAASS